MAIPSNMFSTTGQPKTAADYALLKAGYTGSFTGNDALNWYNQNQSSTAKDYRGSGRTFEGYFNTELKKMQATALNDSGDSGGFSKLYGSNDPFGAATRYDYNPEMGSGGTYIPGQTYSFDTYKEPEKAPYQPAMLSALMNAGLDPKTLQPAAGTATGVAGSSLQKASVPLAPGTAPAAPASGRWNVETATELGQMFGLLQPGQIAQGGVLDAALAAAPESVRNQFNQLRNMVETGASEDDIVNMLVDREIANQQSDPSYGSLAKPAYKDYKPFQLSDFMADPGYQFRLSEGNKAIDRTNAAKGRFYSGAALKEATKFGSELATDEFGRARDRFVQDFGISYGQKKDNADTLYNRLAGISNSGSSLTNTAVNANQNNANAMGNIYGQAGNAQAANSLNQGSNINSTLSSLLNAVRTSSYSNVGNAAKTAANLYRYS